MSNGHPSSINIDWHQGSCKPSGIGASRANRNVSGASQIQEYWQQIETIMARGESCRAEMRRVLCLAAAAFRSQAAR